MYIFTHFSQTIYIFVEHGNSQPLSDSLSTIAMMTVVGSAFTGPYLMTIAAIYADIDYTYYPLEAILPDPIYRNFQTIITALLIRLVFLFWGCVEGWRTFLFLVYLGFILIERAVKILMVLTSRVFLFRDFYKNYIYFKLVYSKVEKVVQVITYISFSIYFWALVASYWVCVQGTIEKVTLPLYLMFALVALAITLAHFLILPLLCGAMEMAIHVVAVHRQKARFQYVKFKGFGYKLNVLRVAGIQPVRLRYGMFWTIRMEFLGEYVWLIVNRTFDAILVVDF